LHSVDNAFFSVFSFDLSGSEQKTSTQEPEQESFALLLLLPVFVSLHLF
jgi:hypothetical protein